MRLPFLIKNLFTFKRVDKTPRILILELSKTKHLTKDNQMNKEEFKNFEYIIKMEFLKELRRNGYITVNQSAEIEDKLITKKCI